MSRLHVVKPTELGLTPRKVTMCCLARNMPIAYAAYTVCYSVGVGNKGPWIGTEYVSTAKMKDERYIPPFPVSFVQGEF